MNAKELLKQENDLVKSVELKHFELAQLRVKRLIELEKEIAIQQRIVIGFMFLDEACYEAGLKSLKRDFFTNSEFHLGIFDTILATHSCGYGSQVVVNEMKKEAFLLKHNLIREQIEEKISIYRFNAELSFAGKSNCNLSAIKTSIEVLKQLCTKREVIKKVERYAGVTYELIKTEDVLLKIKDDIANFLPQLTVEQVKYSYSEAVVKSLHNKQSIFVRTGYKPLDEILRGFKLGQLIVIGGSTGTGKSAFAVNLALNFCSQDKRVALFSFEMNEGEVLQRIFGIRLGYDSSVFDTERVDELVYNRIRKYSETTKDYIEIRTNYISSLSDFYIHCERLKNNDIHIVIIDYLQLISLSEKQESRVKELEKITKFFKRTAAELQIVIIALSQLSRERTKRQNPTPLLSDLRDSGSIEQDANLVLLLNRDPIKNQGFMNDVNIDIIVAKNRSGGTGVATLSFQSKYTKFV